MKSYMKKVYEAKAKEDEIKVDHAMIGRAVYRFGKSLGITAVYDPLTEEVSVSPLDTPSVSFEKLDHDDHKRFIEDAVELFDKEMAAKKAAMDKQFKDLNKSLDRHIEELDAYVAKIKKG